VGSLDINFAHCQSGPRRHHRRIPVPTRPDHPAPQVRQTDGCLQRQLHNFESVTVD
jgi:hypothetical protein